MIEIVETKDYEKICKLAKAGGADMHDLEKLDLVWMALVDKEEVGVSGIRNFEKYYVVDMLAVKPEFHKKGIEKKLLEAIIEHAKKNKIKTLYTMFKKSHREFGLEVGFKLINFDELPKDYDGACLTCDQRGETCFPEPMELNLR